MASVILLFPLPLGYTTDVTPGTKSTDTRSAKDLNPAISNLFKNTKGLPPILRCYKCCLYKNKRLYGFHFLTFINERKVSFYAQGIPSFKGIPYSCSFNFFNASAAACCSASFSTCHYQDLRPRYLT